MRVCQFRHFGKSDWRRPSRAVLQERTSKNYSTGAWAAVKTSDPEIHHRGMDECIEFLIPVLLRVSVTPW